MPWQKGFCREQEQWQKLLPSCHFQELHTRILVCGTLDLEKSLEEGNTGRGRSLLSQAKSFSRQVSIWFLFSRQAESWISRVGWEHEMVHLGSCLISRSVRRQELLHLPTSRLTFCRTITGKLGELEVEVPLVHKCLDLSPKAAWWE